MTKGRSSWAPFSIIIGGLIGTILGSLLAYFFQGEFPYDVLAGGLFASTILTVIQIIRMKSKKDNVPEADERVARNIARYFLYTSHIFLAILFIALAVFTLLDYEALPILYLWIFFFAYIGLSGIGGLIVKRR
ncbi:hypothetical protein J4760_02630 [Salinicoccus sp. ID82-1]|uniref:DUF2178 domain-containing protein n=1 Tax=Salinicoccus cyprini TaxID=2493691 RepID=A0A558AYQ9_9STAP|nr:MULTISPECIES: hypothetical protein [Salinicoccus]MCG1008944.1 hypothetical protein [Salinicoccus sp. ID82-1]TVT29398.1 hypothetical protein FO441_03705 [Salinicoccus cyprini]